RTEPRLSRARGGRRQPVVQSADGPVVESYAVWIVSLSREQFYLFCHWRFLVLTTLALALFAAPDDFTAFNFTTFTTFAVFPVLTAFTTLACEPGWTGRLIERGPFWPLMARRSIWSA